MAVDGELLEYIPGEAADALMIHWYVKITNTGEKKNLMGADTVLTFIKFFEGKDLVLKTNSELGIWFAAWYEPTFDGAFQGMWTDKSKRGTKTHLRAVEQAFEYGLSKWPILLGTTRQEHIIDEHVRLGYTVLGKIPKLWYGDDVWLMYLTRESYMNRKVTLIKRPAKEDAA